jgi:pilus assembly protein CpaF
MKKFIRFMQIGGDYAMILQNRVVLHARSQGQEPQLQNQGERLPEFTEIQDDSWLNDGGMKPQPKPYFEDDATIPLPKPVKTVAPASNLANLGGVHLKKPDNNTGGVQAQKPGNEGAPLHAHVSGGNAVGTQSIPPKQPQPLFAPQAPLAEYIVVGHPLWPLVLQLSERIWHELYQKPDITSVSDFVLIEFVRKQAIEMLRTEPNVAGQVHDLSQAELVLHSVVNETLGYGPLEPLIKDESIYEITAVGPRFTYVERNGTIEDMPCVFEDDRHMQRIVENMLRRAGRRIKPNWPIIDVRLPDGSLVNIVMPPNAVNGPTITIRKRSKKPFTMEDLVQLGSLSQEMADFLSSCVQNRLNIVVCGGIASGRTTLLNALSAFIPEGERITTIEEAAELQLGQKHVVALVSQLNGGEGGGVTMRDLVMNALRTGSERIVLGECRSDEVLAMMQAISSGYNGVLLNLFASNLKDCLAHLETMCLAANPHLPAEVIRKQLASSLDIIVHVARLRDGSRKVLNIAEVQGFDGNAIKLQSIYHFKESGLDQQSGQVQGEFLPSGFKSQKI